MRWLLWVVAAVGCGSSDAESPARLRISSLDQWDTDRLVEAAFGADMFMAANVEAFQRYAGRPDGCPSIALDSVVGITTNDCCITNQDPSICFFGSAEVENPRSWPGIVNNATSPTRYDLHALEIRKFHVGTSYYRLDGTLQIENGTWTSDLVSGYGPDEYPNDPLLESVLEYRCDESVTACDLVGRMLWAGQAVDVSGSVTWADPRTMATGDVTLRGVDSLTATVTHAPNCEITWRLDSPGTYPYGTGCVSQLAPSWY